MTVFDSVLVSSSIALLACFLGILFGNAKGKKQKGIILLAILIVVALLSLCSLARRLQWESTLLHIPQDPVPEATAVPSYTPAPENTANSSHSLPENTIKPPDSSWLSLTVVHFPNIKQNDFVLGGVWSLPLDIFGDEEQEISYIVTLVDNDGNVICEGNAKYGTVWNEDQSGNWKEEPEELKQASTNEQIPLKSYGTFVVDFSKYSEFISSGNYSCVVSINLSGIEYTSQATFEIN